MVRFSRNSVAILGGLLAITIVLGACGSSSKSESGASTSTTRARTTTTARSGSSTTTAVASNCTAEKFTMADIPKLGGMSTSSLALSKITLTNDSKYAMVSTKLANGDPSNGLPYFFACVNNAWSYKASWTASGMVCGPLSAAEVAAVVELASKTSSQWACI